MGKKARHSRSVSWHPAWRADSDSSDSEGDAAPSKSSIARRAPAGRGPLALQPVEEEGAEDRSKAQQQHQQHQQARSEPQPRQPSTTATATANAAVDTNSISSPVSLSPYASQNTSGLYVQSGSMTFAEDTYGKHASYGQQDDGEKESRDYNAAAAHHNHNQDHDDEESDDSEGCDGDFPDTIVIEDDALSPPVDMSDPATNRFDFHMMHHDHPLSSNADPHANPDSPHALTSEGTRNLSVGQAARPLPYRADTAQFFQRDDILNRTTSFPMAPENNQQDSVSGDQQPYNQSITGQAHALPQNAADNGTRNSTIDSEINEDGDAFFDKFNAAQNQYQTDDFVPEQEMDSTTSHNYQTQPVPQIVQFGSTQPVSETRIPHASPDRDVQNLMAPQSAENDDHDEDIDDRLSTLSKPMYDATENDVRYDEGIPLIKEPQNSQGQTQTRPGLTASALKKHNRTISSIFATDEPTEGEDFFKAVLTSTNDEGPSTTNGGSAPRALRRKSTLDVLGSMSFENGNEAAESSIMEAIAEDPEISQEQPDATQTNSQDIRETPEINQEDDLAEKWKAMGFDDDELLTEDSMIEPPVDASATPAGPIQNFSATPTPGANVGDYFGNTANYTGTSYHITAPQTQQHMLPKENPYAPHQPSTADLVTGFSGLDQPSNPIAPFTPLTAPEYTPLPQQRQENVKPPSFAENKESYKSPYDLPEDLTRQTRRHPHPVPPKVPAPIPYGAPQSSAAPPPRRSSLQNEHPSGAIPPPPRPSTQSPNPPAPPPKANTPSNFFEELPAVAPRSRSRPRVQKAYTPAPQTVPPPPVPRVPQAPFVQPQPPVHSPYGPSSSSRPSSSASNHTVSAPFGLQRPGPVDPYTSNLPGMTASPPVPPPPKASVRYSPKPPNVPVGITPPASTRYSPAPGMASSASRYAPAIPRESSLSPPPRPILPFQPRTSSPLASSGEQASDTTELVDNSISPPIPIASSAPLSKSLSHDGPDMVPRATPPPPPPALSHDNNYNAISASPPASHHQYKPIGSPEPVAPPVYSSCAPSSTSQAYSPHVGTASMSPPPPPMAHGSQTRTAPQPRPAPPSRSMTQSSGQGTQAQALRASMQSPPRTAPSSSVALSSMLSPGTQQSKGPAPEFDFIAPTDGREMDPLQRWKGCPIFKFGFNDTAISTFPKRVPRYASGHIVPRIMPTVGELRVRRASPLVSTDENLDKERRKFPGPLRSKAKKKDVVAWLSSMINIFECSEQTTVDESALEKEEKVILWKLVRVLVEHDGLLSGNPSCEASIRSILSTPGQAQGLKEAQYQEPKATNTDMPLEIMKDLMSGQREKAVWRAVDNKLWGHAMLLSSTLQNKTVWKQVASEFIRKEIMPFGESGKPLAAAYEVFAGNMEEAVDHLVPPSARAGLHMVSKDNVNSGVNGSGFEGLEKWRETVQIILSNRTPNDSFALRSLSQLLASSNRTSASHVCAILAAPPSQRTGSAANVSGGINDPNALFVLLGWDHRRHPSAINNDTDAICLTEAYEFATSQLSGEPTRVMPHLQAFKLHHAMCLAESGQILEAQQYCEVLASTFKPSTSHSPYYNTVALTQLDNLMKQLEQLSAATGSSWISKPSMNKVSDSVWAKFSSFVAGEDADGVGASKSINQVSGPFANVTGTMSTPSLANQPMDTSGPCMPRPPSVPLNSAAARYANVQSSSPYVPQSPSSNRSSLDSQRPTNIHAGYQPQRGYSYERQAPTNDENDPPAQHTPYVPSLHTSGHLQADLFSSMTHTPLSPVVENFTEPQAKPSSIQGGSMMHSPMSAGPQAPPTQSFETLNSVNVAAPSPHSYMSASSGYQAPEGNTGYVPPSYEPPSYEPPSDGHVDLDSSSDSAEEAPKPKKKSIMDDDDDDDILSRAEAVKKEEKARHDREAAERVRKAAEEDAKRNEAKSQKKGWFTGWFGKKNSDDHGANVVRAKLGEESSFYYDKELKRWVNRKDPNSAKPAASSLPPPPKASGPPKFSAPSSQASPVPSTSASPLPAPPQVPGVTMSRPPSDVKPPTAGPPLQVRPPAMAPPSSTPTPPAKAPSGPSSLAPPPKPPSLSNASSIDDLLGAPAPKTHTGRSKKKGRGYVDIMAK